MRDFSRWPVFSFLSPTVVSKIKFAVVFGTGNEVVYVTVDDQAFVFTSGQNACKPLLIEKLSNIGIIDIKVGGASMFVALTKNGEVFHCGQKNTFPAVAFAPEPTACIVELPKQNITKVSCGFNHAVALTGTGEVYFWGNDSVQNQPAVIKVGGGLNGKVIKDVECGYYFSIALTDDGEPFSWGLSSSGELGYGGVAPQYHPVKVTGLQGTVISQIVCGASHSLVLTDQGHIYGWGYNGQGQLATGVTTNQLSPIRVAADLGCIDTVAAVNRCHVSAAITKFNEVYVWGVFRGQNFLKPCLTSLNNIDDVFSCLTGTCVSSWRPLIVEKDQLPKNSLREILKNSFDDNKTSDISFNLEGRQIHAHKALLKIRCEHFRLMFQENAWVDGGKKEIDISQYSYPVYRAFLYYLYTDELNLTPETAVGILDLAKSYFEDDLKLICSNKIKNLISVENVIQFYDASRHFSAKELEDFCFNFCLENMSAVTQTEQFGKLDEVTFKHFVIEASKSGAYKN